jgi:hypothetical protein
MSNSAQNRYALFKVAESAKTSLFL